MEIIQIFSQSPVVILILTFLSCFIPFIRFERKGINTILMVSYSLFLGLLLLVSYQFGALNQISYEFEIYKNVILELKLSKIGFLYSCFIIFMWPPAYAYSQFYLESMQDKNVGRFLFFLNFSFSWTILLTYMNDMLSLFISYEILTLSTAALICHDYTNHVNKAFKKYLLYLIGASVALWLPAILILKVKFGVFSFGRMIIDHYDHQNAAVLKFILWMCIFGVAKAAIFPMHGWLPSAMAANYPTSAILHAVLVVNTGIYVLWRVINEIFGLDIIKAIFSLHDPIYYILLAGIIYSSFKSATASNMKKILAWSTVCQLNLVIFIALSSINFSKIFSLTTILYHSFVKITLFFCAGIIYAHNYATRLEEFRGSLKRFTFEYIVFFVSSALVIGFPLLLCFNYKNPLINMAYNENLELLLLEIIISSSAGVYYLGRAIAEMSSYDRDIIEAEEKHHRPKIIFLRAATIYCFLAALTATFLYKNIYQSLTDFLGK